MGLYAIKNGRGRNETRPVATGQTFAKGDLLDWDGNGALVGVADDAETGAYVALEAVTNAAAGTKIVVVATKGNGTQFKVNTEADTAEDQIGDVVEFSDKSTLANGTAASADGFQIQELVGTPSDRVVRGIFL